MYVGTAVTDDDGVAVIELPEYFDALNRDARIQLTPVGQLALVGAEGEEGGNRFAIRSDKPGVTVSWLVTATRQDPWAEAHRMVVEPEKFAGKQSKPGIGEEHPLGTSPQQARPDVQMDELEGRLIQLQKESRLAQERLQALMTQEAALRETVERVTEMAKAMRAHQTVVNGGPPLVT